MPKVYYRYSDPEDACALIDTQANLEQLKIDCNLELSENAQPVDIKNKPVVKEINYILKKNKNFICMVVKYDKVLDSLEHTV